MNPKTPTMKLSSATIIKAPERTTELEFSCNLTFLDVVLGKPTSDIAFLGRRGGLRRGITDHLCLQYRLKQAQP